MDIRTQFPNKHILIVDDDVELNSSIKEILIISGFKEISCAYNITEGINIFTTQNIDLIILDIMLPDGEGYLLSDYIRKSSDIPIIFLTAKNNPEDEIKGLKSGGDDFITKPFLPKVLIYRIISLLRRSYKEDTNIIQLKNSIINLGNATVLNNETEFSLTPIEIQIIRKLYTNKNYIVSTESICDSVWGIDSYGYEKSLMVHIRNIREKIESNPSKPEYLITVKGLGYKLVI
ncbi:response regulator transcription factor [Streptococcus macacae]|uniref:Response regulator receiver domain protein n=1 Tax=Streptococcus macacae NCTC 11558 TaxID=764298 RepID=G5JV75_9STRE|nr:response regulator transcription factor [Streptococcus macacae]EHJ53285.1 response regulator receiver domain protein [Streptococcus macacae NCTC 11558]SUN77700.1 response regulator [Streptococcus macacae NCTC 11558]